MMYSLPSFLSFNDSYRRALCNRILSRTVTRQISLEQNIFVISFFRYSFIKTLTSKKTFHSIDFRLFFARKTKKRTKHSFVSDCTRHVLLFDYRTKNQSSSVRFVFCRRSNLFQSILFLFENKKRRKTHVRLLKSKSIERRSASSFN